MPDQSRFRKRKLIISITLIVLAILSDLVLTAINYELTESNNIPWEEMLRNPLLWIFILLTILYNLIENKNYTEKYDKRISEAHVEAYKKLINKIPYEVNKKDFDSANEIIVICTKLKELMKND